NLIFADIGDVIEDQEVILVELGERAFECQFSARNLQTLDEVAGAHEQHAPSVLDQREPNGSCEMALAAAGRNSVIMPGVWDLKSRSFTRSILATEPRCPCSPASTLGMRHILLFGSPTAR